MHIEGNGKLTTKPYPDGYESEQQFRKALAQREWVGLTDDERLEISKDVWGRDKLEHGRDDHRPFYVDFAREIEAKLKEKNGG